MSTIAKDEYGAPKLDPAPAPGSVAALFEEWMDGLRKNVANGVAGLDADGAIAGTIKVRSGTNDQLSSFVLAAGEQAFATDTNTLKIGDGTKTFSALTGISGGAGGGFSSAQTVVVRAAGAVGTISPAAGSITVVDYYNEETLGPDQTTLRVNPANVPIGQEVLIMVYAQNLTQGSATIAIDLAYSTAAGSSTQMAYGPYPTVGEAMDSGGYSTYQVIRTFAMEEYGVILLRLLCVPNVLGSQSGTNAGERSWFLISVTGNSAIFGMN